MKKDNISHLDVDSLKKEVELLKKELFNLRLNASAMHVKDCSQFRKLRVRIARALTLIQQRSAYNTSKSI